MAVQRESVFRYAVPSPDTRMVTRLLVCQIPYLTFLLAIIWPLGVFPSWIVLAFYVGFVVVTIGTMFLVSLSFKQARIAVGPAGMVFGTGFWRRRMGWPEVESVAFEELKLTIPLEKLLRGDTSAPRVRVDLRRHKLFVTVPGRRFVTAYLDEPDRFVQEAQRYLTPAHG